MQILLIRYPRSMIPKFNYIKRADKPQEFKNTYYLHTIKHTCAFCKQKYSRHKNDVSIGSHDDTHKYKTARTADDQK